MKQYIIGKSREDGKLTHYHSEQEAERDAIYWKVMDGDSYRDAKMAFQEWELEYMEQNN